MPSRLVVIKVNDLGSSDIERISEFLDCSETACAYQYPYPSQGDELIFYVMRGNVMVFSGRAVKGYLATRYLPFIRTLTFNRGPVASTLEDFIIGVQMVESWAKGQGFVRIDMNPDYFGSNLLTLVDQLSTNGWQISSSHSRYTLRTQLGSDDEQILAEFSKSGRYQVRRGVREGIRTVEVMDVSLIDLFVGLHNEMTHRKGLERSDGSLLHALWELKVRNPTRLAIILAYHDEILLGGNVYFRAGDRVEYLFGAISKNKNILHGDVSAGYPLQYAGMKWSRSVSALEYDFGGFTPQAKTGPAFMKKSCVANPIALELAPSFFRVLKPRTSKMLNFLKTSFKIKAM